MVVMEVVRVKMEAMAVKPVVVWAEVGFTEFFVLLDE